MVSALTSAASQTALYNSLLSSLSIGIFCSKYLNEDTSLYNKKVLRKCEVVPVHTMKAYRGSRGIAPLILNLNIR